MTGTKEYVDSRIRSSPLDYEPNRDAPYRRPIYHAAALALKRFLPGAAQATLISGGIHGVLALAKASE